MSASRRLWMRARASSVVAPIALALVARVHAAEPTAVPSPAVPFGRLALDPIVVTATRLPEPLLDVPAALSVVEKPAIQEARPTVGLEESLSRVPGVLVQSARNFAQDARLQIRGFGTRAAFGIRELRVLVDGLPLTLPDGQTEIDDLDLGIAERIEVLRGPASALYGNASGGVVQVFTDPPRESPAVTTRLEGGSYGFQKYLVKGGDGAGAVRAFASGSFFDLDGYRDHARARRGIVTGKLRWAPDDRTSVTTLLTLLDTPTADDPGALTIGEVRADRRQARALNRLLDAGESVRQGRLGFVGRHLFEAGELSGYAYGVARDFQGTLPIPAEAGDGVTTLDRLSPGGGLRWTSDGAVAGRPWTLLAGVDVQHQDDRRRRFANDGGRRGALGLDQDEQVTSVGPYARLAVDVVDAVEVSVGLRWDAVRYAVDVDVPAGEPSGSRTLTAWSPAGGVRWSPCPWLSLYGNVTTGFQTPTTTELATVAGGFDPDLEPQKALSGELGARLERDDRWRLGLAGFVLAVRDEIVPFEAASGRSFFRNAGRSRRLGFEADWTVELLPGLRWTAAVSVLDARYVRYETDAGDFDGNQEPGIPGWIVYDELAYRHASGAYAALEVQAVDGFELDDANTADTDAYAVLTLRGGWDGLVRGWRIEPFVGIGNVTDTHYEGTVRLNALGGRYFEPAAGVSVYGGLVIAARF